MALVTAMSRPYPAPPGVPRRCRPHVRSQAADHTSGTVPSRRYSKRMPALYLSLAIVSEVAATLALRSTEGFSRPLPVAVVVVGYGLSFWLLALALKHIPISLTYAIWSGVGTALVAVAGVLAFGETMNAMKLASLAIIVLGVAGLSAAGGAH